MSTQSVALAPAAPTTDLNFLIDTIYPAANASYLIMSVPSPSLPPGYTLVGPLEANMHDALPAMAQSKPSEQRPVDNMLAESNVFGLIAWNEAEKTALVAFRGTKTLWEWIEDLDALTWPYLPDPEAGAVHMGFQLVYEHIRQCVARLLSSGCPGARRVVVTGHSLGGAVALLGAYNIAKNLLPGVPVEVYTLAGPRTGTGLFVSSFKQMISKCYRVVNHGDLVPEVPLPPLYEHAGQSIGIAGGFQLLDVTYAHHLTTYLTGLHTLSGQPRISPAGATAGGMVAP